MTTWLSSSIARSRPVARVFGPERWWWALHTHPYLSLRSVWWQWLNGLTPPFQPEYVIVNDNVRADIEALN